MEVSLGCPTEVEAQLQPGAVRDWIAAWHTWLGPGKLVWSERRWRVMGQQRLPETLVLENAQGLAAWIGEEERWTRACSRYGYIVSRWPSLAARLPRHFEALAGYPDQDIMRLEALLAWLESHPCSNLYLRQIPVAGMDTKWFEGRMPMVADLVATLRGDERGNLDFLERCGLRGLPNIVRFRLLDQELRERVGTLSDVAAPISEVADLRLQVSRVYIVENVQTGLCFGDRPGAIVFMGLGYNVTSLECVPWVAEADCLYWGDLDTHGFAILNRARASLPNLVSALMDEPTLLNNRSLWVEEKDPHTLDLPLLTGTEQAVYQGLVQHRWGLNVRLEQERIAWNEASQVLDA